MIEFVIGLLLGNLLKSCPNQEHRETKPLTEKEVKEITPLVLITVLMGMAGLALMYLMRY